MDAAATLRLDGAQVLVRLLQAEGVTQAFGIVGGKLGPLLHALSTSPIRFTGVRHEAAAPMMAAATFAATGRLALAMGEMGPGGLNLASGTGVAFNNNLAALLVTTNQHRAAAYPHRGMVTVIHNNAAWGIIRAGQRNQLDFELGTSLADTDYAAIARGFGCSGETVERAEDLAPALQRALASGLPAVLDCRTRFMPHPAMPAFGRMNRFGFDAAARLA